MMLSNVMENYFKNDKIIKEANDSFSPVKIKKSEWFKTKSTLQRSFTFKKRKFKEAFIVELLRYCRDTSCDIEFYVKKEDITIVINSISPYVSELELECSRDILKINKDVSYYYADNE